MPAVVPLYSRLSDAGYARLPRQARRTRLPVHRLHGLSGVCPSGALTTDGTTQELRPDADAVLVVPSAVLAQFAAVSRRRSCCTNSSDWASAKSGPPPQPRRRCVTRSCSMPKRIRRCDRSSPPFAPPWSTWWRCGSVVDSAFGALRFGHRGAARRVRQSPRGLRGDVPAQQTALVADGARRDVVLPARVAGRSPASPVRFTLA